MNSSLMNEKKTRLQNAIRFIAKNCVIIFLMIVFWKQSLSQTIPIHLDRRNTNQMLAISKKADASSDSSYDIQTSGNDPFIYSYSLSQSFDPNNVYFLSFDYLAPNGLDNLQIYFGPPISESSSIKVGALAATTSYKTFNINIRKYTGEWNKSFVKLRFDFGKSPNQKISVKNISLRAPSASEIDLSSVNKNKEFKTYLNSSFSNKVRDVIVDKESITIRGDISNGSSDLYLCELPIFEDISINLSSPVSVTPIDAHQSSFEIKVKRLMTINDTAYDRIYSRWAIASKNGNAYQLQSFYNYAEDIYDAAYQYLPENKPLSKKGIGGFVAAGNSTPDLADLNIKNATVNFIIPNIISLTPTQYDEKFNGQTFYFNPTTVNNLDNTLKTCSNNNVRVSAIILIPENISQPLKSILVHANANGGAQSMANITSITGLNYYAAVIAFLADRYCRADAKFGRISNWIVHNEVDNGDYWANAGTTELEYYTELYDRSLRTVYYTVRQYDPAAKVFLSLTHFWSGTAKAIFLPPKEMLNTFNELSNKQGDYEWGIAYHPYPENAFDAKSWNDKDATDDINTTKYITPKNIELIDQWIRTKEHLYKNLKVRTLLFSEQGVHSRSYSKQDLLDQAAGLAYMWKKVERLPSLEAFDYHHQTDNKGELGLLLGLWTVKPGTTGTPDQKKPAWYVYQKAGTPSEDSAFAFALPIIGVKNWSQTFYPLNGEVNPYTVIFNVTNAGAPLNDVSIFFDGEMHKTINGKAAFYNVASISKNRTYRLTKNGQSIYREQQVMIDKDQTIAIDVSK